MRVEDDWRPRYHGYRQDPRTVDINQIYGALAYYSLNGSDAARHIDTEAKKVSRGFSSICVAGDRKTLGVKSVVSGESEKRAGARRHHFRLPSAPVDLCQDVAKAQLRASKLTKLIQEQDPHSCSFTCRAIAPSTQK
jgi:hypothetical protein